MKNGTCRAVANSLAAVCLAHLVFPNTALAYVVISDLGQAATEYHELVGVNIDNQTTQVVTGPTAFANVTQPNGGATSIARSSSKTTGVYATANSLPLHSSTISNGWVGWSSTSQATLRIPNLVLFGDCAVNSPVDPSSGATLPLCGSGTVLDGVGTIPVSLNMLLDGSITNAIFGTLGTTIIDSYISLTVSAAIPTFDGSINLLGSTAGFAEFEMAILGPAGIRETLSDTGFLKDLPWSGGTGSHAYSGNVTTGTMLLPVNVPFELELELLAHVDAVMFGTTTTSAQGTVDFLDTFGLPTNAPILNLPSGYRFDGASVGIADNCIGICSAAPDPSTGVPEPSTYALFFASLIAWTGSRSNRKQNSNLVG